MLCACMHPCIGEVVVDISGDLFNIKCGHLSSVQIFSSQVSSIDLDKFIVIAIVVIDLLVSKFTEKLNFAVDEIYS